MNPTTAAVRAGVSRGWTELRNSFANWQDLWGYFFPTAILLIVMFFMRNSTVPGTTFSLGTRTLPSTLGMGLAFTGMVGVAQQLLVEREDGTLLRAKAVPNGMLGYLIGKVVSIACVALIGLVLQVVPATLFLHGLAIHGVGGWLTLLWVVVLGLLATLPIGAVLGSLFEDARNFGLIVLPIMGSIAISGIFYPINSLPGWVQAVGQALPIYWLGLGMRSALLPDGMAAVELGHSWRHLETALALGVWAVLGLVLAPVVLRRMARRESGSRVAARREKAMQRVN
ncbi:ABC transporter permease [Plantactinospora siamensis]|uniref:ABC transporter permease n=1 Tax=Plantactinospora siamensis TaxID=555372 RepID=A0ABV6NUQ2_9ACTN